MVVVPPSPMPFTRIISSVACRILNAGMTNWISRSSKSRPKRLSFASLSNAIPKGLNSLPASSTVTS